VAPSDSFAAGWSASNAAGEVGVATSAAVASAAGTAD